MRTPLVAANWKMNLDLPRMRALVSALREGLGTAPRVEVAVCPAYPYLFPMAKALAGSPIRLGAQNVHHEAQGAFTGEVSAAMLRETGAVYVIIGHSERRHTIGRGEDDRWINRKLRAALAAGIAPILCVGETLAERQSGQTLDVLSFQLSAGLSGVPAGDAERVVLAYEPVWAIGTGHNATPQQAQEAHAHLRGRLAGLFGERVSTAVRILYGGSVKADNAEAILRQQDVDGSLVGGASLSAETFLPIVRAALACAEGRA